MKTVGKLSHAFKTVKLLYSWRDKLGKSDKLMILDII